MFHGGSLGWQTLSTGRGVGSDIAQTDARLLDRALAINYPHKRVGHWAHQGLGRQDTGQTDTTRLTPKRRQAAHIALHRKSGQQHLAGARTVLPSRADRQRRQMVEVLAAHRGRPDSGARGRNVSWKSDVWMAGSQEETT